MRIKFAMLTLAMVMLSGWTGNRVDAQGPYRTPFEQKTVSWMDFPYQEPRPAQRVAPAGYPLNYPVVPVSANPQAAPGAFYPGQSRPANLAPVIASPLPVLGQGMFTGYPGAMGGNSMSYIPAAWAAHRRQHVEPKQPIIRVSPFTYESGSGFVFGAGVGFLKPHFDNNTAFTLQDQRGFPNFTDRTRSFDYNYEAAPRIWLGYVGPCGLGARIRYWDFNYSSNTERFTDAFGNFTITSQPTPTNSNGFVLGGNPGDSIVATSLIDTDTIDADITQRFDIVDWQVNVGGGVRHLGLAQRYSATGFNGNTVIATSNIGRRFDGIGPTMFAEIRRPLFETSFSLIANGRGSFLFGESKLFARDALPNGPIDTALLVNDATLAIGEIQIGGEWARELKNGCYAFLQVMWEAQHWDNAGNASSNLDDLGLTGVNITAGIWR